MVRSGTLFLTLNVYDYQWIRPVAGPVESMAPFFRGSILCGALLFLTACASQPSYDASRGPYDAAYAHPTYGTWSDDDYRYRLAAGDELALRFLVNPDLNAPVIIGPDGRGVFPLVGPIKVAGLTADEAANLVTASYASALRQPAVEVLVTNYASAQIYVGGEVRDPGVHPVKGALTVGQAIMTAGGFANTARTGKVAVIRQRPGDSRVLLKIVDVKSLLAHGSGDGADFAVLPGDLIFVPRSRIAEVDLFTQQYLTGAVPFSTSVSYSAGSLNYH